MIVRLIPDRYRIVFGLFGRRHGLKLSSLLLAIQIWCAYCSISTHGTVTNVYMPAQWKHIGMIIRQDGFFHGFHNEYVKDKEKRYCCSSFKTAYNENITQDEKECNKGAKFRMVLCLQSKCGFSHLELSEHFAPQIHDGYGV